MLNLLDKFKGKIMEQKKDIIYSGLISFSWILKSEEYAKNNNDFSNILKNHEHTLNGKINNAGTLMAFSYLTLVFPKESGLFNEIDTVNYDSFQCLMDTRNSFDNFTSFLRRIRNSISHSNVEVHDNKFIFKDGPPNGDINFKTIISVPDFGNFLVHLINELNKE